MVDNEFPNVANVIFLIEGTAINGIHFTDMKVNYIIPTLEYFMQGSNNELDNAAKGTNMFGIVLYRTTQSIPSCLTYGPFAEPQQVQNVIDKLE